MIIRSIRVQNFRCIRDETLPCEKLTALIGPNGSGKSSFLRALDLFYDPGAKYTEDDFYATDTSRDIIITVTFSDLADEEKGLFKKYVEDGQLTVEKEMKWPRTRENQKYFGTSLQNPHFGAFRSAKGTQLRLEYKKLCDGECRDLPAYQNRDQAEKDLQAWEETHPDKCVRQKDGGQFFGFKEVGEAHLEHYTRFIAVPAVRDASEDAAEGRGTPLTEIMDLVVRNVLAERKEIRELQDETQKRYEKIVDPSKLEELQTLEQDLSNTLTTYVPDAGVKLTWFTEEIIDIPMPKAKIQLVEDEFASSVERTGHGLQRAFILTMLQHLAVAESPMTETTNGEQEENNEVGKEKFPLRVPNLIIGIEEPELYQHPNRQRHLSKILLKLAEGSIKGVAEQTQIIYTTHSPLFVDIQRFGKVRKLRKVKEEKDKPKQTRLIYTNWDEVAKIIEEADAKKPGSYSGETLHPRLQTLMTPWMNEGFFADLAVLVEGEEDRAAILGVAKALGHDFEAIGISVIPCMGKNNIDRPSVIFSKLEIPVYAIWDGDCGTPKAKPEENHRLLRLFNHNPEDWPEKLTERFACFKKDLQETLCTEIGQTLFDTILEESCDRLCLGKKKHAVKNPQVIQEIIDKAHSQGKSSKTLESIISKILEARHCATSVKDA